MKPQRILLLAASAGLLALPCQAGSSSSPDYSITADTANMGGSMVGSPDYNVLASVGSIGGVSSEATSGYLAKHGFPGQFYNVVGVIPTSTASTVNERAPLQLGASQVMDDATFLTLDHTAASWSVVSGPMSGVNSLGVATAASVYQDTAATLSITWQSFTGTLDLTVLNVTGDDFGTYAGDSLPDDWQVQYFGQDNPLAAPDMDADGTGQTNLFKYVAGLNPTDPASVFRVSVQPVTGQPDQKQIVFSPVLADRTYTVVYNTNLSDSAWSLLTGATQSDNGQQRSVTDTNSAEMTKFYRVRISKP